MMKEKIKTITEMVKELNSKFQKQRIVNPTENIMCTKHDDLEFIEGLYIAEDSRNESANIIFGGRSEYRDVIMEIYSRWSKALNGEAVTMKFLSGLHAHTILFMSIGSGMEKVMILPELAGGHPAAIHIIQRLGYETIDMVVDCESQCIDVEKTKKLIEAEKPDIIFVDRSDGLYYEDFSWLEKYTEIYKIFDASQYITQILCDDYMHPFNMGFDLIISTLHKNFPGPQQALAVTKNKDIYWQQIEEKSKIYISNTHPANIFLAGKMLDSIDDIKDYSKKMLYYQKKLLHELKGRNIEVIENDKNYPNTQHIWIVSSNTSIYDIYRLLEKKDILTNYKKLPYQLGYGLRLGVGALVSANVSENELIELANEIAIIYHSLD